MILIDAGPDRTGRGRHSPIYPQVINRASRQSVPAFRARIAARVWHTKAPLSVNVLRTRCGDCGDFVGTICRRSCIFAGFCSISVSPTGCPQNAKSPAIAGLLLVGARGFEPPTPSLPD
jgi:hypothetical protein